MHGVACLMIASDSQTTIHNFSFKLNSLCVSNKYTIDDCNNVYSKSLKTMSMYL